MNYYEQRLTLLDREKLPKEVFGDGRSNHKSNAEYWDDIQVGTKVFPTAWFLRNIPELENVADIAANGLTVIEKGYINDPEGRWKLGTWQTERFNALWFKETAIPMNFKYVVSQMIWKIVK